MENFPASLIVLAMCVALAFMAMRAAGAATQVMTQMFNSPAELGWPSGVQEDDDFHWGWSGRPAPFADVRRDAGRDAWNQPEIVELGDGCGPSAFPVARP